MKKTIYTARVLKFITIMVGSKAGDMLLEQCLRIYIYKYKTTKANWKKPGLLKVLSHPPTPSETLPSTSPYLLIHPK